MSEPTKVYLVMQFDGDNGTSVAGVFGTREEAERCAASIAKHDDPIVEAWTVGATEPDRISATGGE